MVLPQSVLILLKVFDLTSQLLTLLIHRVSKLVLQFLLQDWNLSLQLLSDLVEKLPLVILTDLLLHHRLLLSNQVQLVLLPSS